MEYKILFAVLIIGYVFGYVIIRFVKNEKNAVKLFLIAFILLTASIMIYQTFYIQDLRSTSSLDYVFIIGPFFIGSISGYFISLWRKNNN
jgi:ABC-type iron transport system FetAB permease component